MNRRSHRANANAEINRFCNLLLGRPVYRHPRNGKIARLPQQTRELITQPNPSGVSKG